MSRVGVTKPLARLRCTEKCAQENKNSRDNSVGQVMDALYLLVILITVLIMR